MWIPVNSNESRSNSWTKMMCCWSARTDFSRIIQPVSFGILKHYTESWFKNCFCQILFVVSVSISLCTPTSDCISVCICAIQQCQDLSASNQCFVFFWYQDMKKCGYSCRYLLKVMIRRYNSETDWQQCIMFKAFVTCYKHIQDLPAGAVSMTYLWLWNSFRIIGNILVLTK